VWLIFCQAGTKKAKVMAFLREYLQNEEIGDEDVDFEGVKDLLEEPERERKVSKAPPVNSKPVITQDAAGVLVRSLVMFSRSCETLVSWMTSICTTAKWDALEPKVRLTQQRAFVRAVLSKLQVAIKSQVIAPSAAVQSLCLCQGPVTPSDLDTEELLRGMRARELEFPEGIQPETLQYLSRITVQGLFKVQEQHLSDVPFGAQVVARAFLTWHIAGSAANPGVGAVNKEYQSTWKKLEHLTPLSWEAIPKRIKDHPWLKGVRMHVQ
jgi:predicted thioredoxin/glutaredoxin